MTAMIFSFRGLFINTLYHCNNYIYIFVSKNGVTIFWNSNSVDNLRNVYHICRNNFFGGKNKAKCDDKNCIAKHGRILEKINETLKYHKTI